MWSNTKLLISSSILVIFLGVTFLWFGLGQAEPAKFSPSPLPSLTTENTPATATSSARPLTPERSDGGRATFGISGERVLVTKVVDGDTIVVNNQSTVRFIGIDTPETVDPRRPVGCFGKEASNETKSLLSGKEVILQKDVSEVDKYKRLLRYIYLPLPDGQSLFVNDYLVREGFGKVLTYPPDVKFNEQLRDAEKEARDNKKGLWGRCN